MSLRLRAAQSIVWTTLESGGLAVLSFVTLVLVARLITPFELGIVTVLIGLIQLLSLPVEIFFHDALVQKSEINDDYYDTAFSASVIIAIFISSCIFFTSNYTSAFFRYENAGLIMCVLCLSLFCSSLGSSLVARQRREFEFKLLAVRSVIGRLAGALAGIGAALSGVGLWSLVIQQVVMTTCATLLLWIYASSRPKFKINPSCLFYLAKFGVSSLTNGFLTLAENRLFMLLVATFQGPVVAGYFNLAFRIVDMPRDVISGGVSNLALPLFQQFIARKGDLNSFYAELVSFTCVVSFPIFVGIALCAPEILSILFGSQWELAGPIVVFFAGLAIPHFATSYSGVVLVAKGLPYLVTPILFVSVSAIVLGMLIVSGNSMWFAALVWGARLLLTIPLSSYILKKAGLISIYNQVCGVMVPLLSCAVMALVVYGFKSYFSYVESDWLRLALVVPVGVIAYFFSIYIIDKQLLSRILSFVKLIKTRRSV